MLPAHSAAAMENETPEPFVSADAAARFLSVTRRHVLELARRGIAGAYAPGTGNERKLWVFRLSELAAAVTCRESSAPIHKSRKLCDPTPGSPR
jgi:hypothetical protein